MFVSVGASVTWMFVPVGGEGDVDVYTSRGCVMWMFVPVGGERDVDVRTSAIKNILESVIDTCKHFGLDVHLCLV